MNKSEIENKIPDTSGLVKKTDYNAKITETENRIPNVSSLATKTALTTVENKIPSISNLVKKKQTITQKLLELKRNLLIINNCDKYIATPELFTLDASDFNARLAEANSVTKTDFDNSVSNLDRKIAANKKKITSNENKLKKLKTFDSSYFSGRSHFEKNGAQNYLVFQPINKYFKVIASTDYISSWKSKGLSNKTIKLPETSDNSLTPALSSYGTKTRINVYGSCLKQPKLSYTHGTIVNIYIAYELGASSSHSDDHTLKNWLFDAVTLLQILISMGTLVMLSDLIENQVFHLQVVDLGAM